MSRLERDGDLQILPCEGLRVSQIRVDYAFGLELAEDQERASDHPWRIRISGEFDFSLGSTTVRIDPEGPAPAFAPALAVRHETLVRGRVHPDDRLVLEFANGAVIDVPPDPRYEAWEAAGGDDANRLILVAGPGSSQSCVRALESFVAAIPGATGVLEEHRADNGEVLPHVLMADLRRFFVSAVESGDRRQVAAFVAGVEQLASSPDGDVRNVVDVSFIEDLVVAHPRSNC